MEWFVAVGGERLGPIPQAELLTLAREGRIKASDLVWHEGVAQWIPAGQATELAGVLGPPIPPVISPLGDDPVLRALLPVGRSLGAIVAGYMGLFSILVFPAPLALVLSILAIIELRPNPRKHGMGRAVFGLVMGALGTTVFVLLLSGAIELL